MNVHIRSELRMAANEALAEAIRATLVYQIPDRRTDQTTEYCPLETRNREMFLPRGCVQTLQTIARTLQIPLTWVPEVTYTPGPARPSKLQPRDYQQDIIRALLSRRQGWVCLPCGGGKTTTGVVASLHTAGATLVLVHMLDLQAQWIATYERAGIKAIALTDGRTPLLPGQVGVALIHALQTDAQPLLDSVTCLLVDECHHIAASMMLSVVSKCPARYRWGFTATPERSDGWGFLLDLLFGPCLYTLSAEELIRMGFLLRPHIIPVATGIQPDPTCYEWSAYCKTCNTPARITGDHVLQGKLTCIRAKCQGELEPVRGDMNFTHTVSQLSASPDRLDQIFQLAQWAAAHDRRTLILVARKQTTTELADRLQAAGIRAAAVTSAVKDREARIEQLRNGTLACMVATQLADEGLDVPALDTVISANPSKDAGRTQQRVGRACRPVGKPPILFDLVDSASTFSRHWYARLNAYTQAYGPCHLSRSPVRVETALTLAEKVKSQ